MTKICLSILVVCLSIVSVSAKDGIEECKTTDLVVNACQPWTLKSGDPSWKDTVKQSLKDGVTVTGGSAYVTLHAANLTSAGLEKAAKAIRDVFQKTYAPGKSMHEHTSAGGISGGNGTEPDIGSHYHGASFVTENGDRMISVSVRVLPLEKDLVGVVISYVKTD